MSSPPPDRVPRMPTVMRWLEGASASLRLIARLHGERWNRTEVFAAFMLDIICNLQRVADATLEGDTSKAESLLADAERAVAAARREVAWREAEKALTRSFS